MSSSTDQRRTKRGWLAPAAIASAAIAASLGVGTLGAYTASITNNNNTAGTGTLEMTETGVSSDNPNNAVAGVACKATSSDGTVNCTDINKYGANMNMKPGQSVKTTIKIQNTGSTDASTFTLTPAQCQNIAGTGQTTAPDLCSVMNVQVLQDGTEVYNGTAAGFTGAKTLKTLASQQSSNFDFIVTLPATASNAVQGGSIKQDLTWTFEA